MPISAALAARLGPGPTRRRWGPYARSREDSGGGVEAPRPPQRPKPAATSTFHGPAEKAATAAPGRRSEVAAGSVAPGPGPARWRRPRRKMVSQKAAVTPGSARRPEIAASVAAAPGPAQKSVAATPSSAQKVATVGPDRQPEVAATAAKTIAAAPAPAGPSSGDGKASQKLNPISNPPNGDEKPSTEENRDGCGGFVFQCALQGHTSAISGISFPLGSDKLYTGSADGSVRVWDCNSGECVDVIKMEGKIGCMLTHGPWVFIGVPKLVQAWNTQTGMKLNLQGPSSLVCSMTITNDILLAGTGDGRIMAWSPRPKDVCIEPVAILSRHERSVISLSVSAGRLLFSGSLDKTIKVWDLRTLQCIHTISEHKAAVTSVLCWGEKLLSCSLDKTVKVWTISESGALQMQHNHDEEHGVRTIFGMHRVGNTPILLCSLHNSNCIRMIDLPSFSHRGTLFSKNEVRTMELAVGLLFTGDCAGELKIWRWLPQEDEVAPSSSPESAVQHY